MCRITTWLSLAFRRKLGSVSGWADHEGRWRPAAAAGGTGRTAPGGTHRGDAAADLTKRW